MLQGQIAVQAPRGNPRKERKKRSSIYSKCLYTLKHAYSVTSVMSDSLKPYGLRRLAGYSPWGRKELNVTEAI